MSPRAAGTRLLLTLVWVTVIALWPPRLWRAQGVSAALLFGFALSVRLPVRRLVSRLGLVWLFGAVMALGWVSQPDWGLRALNLWIKSTLCVTALSLLFHTLTLPETLAGLRWLRVPRLWVDILAFWSRYSSVLAQEWHRLQLARRARMLHPGRPWQFRTLAHAVGLLFIRAYERAEKVHRALLARGYRGGE